MKKQVIAYLHTHWDREWYREYEVFRLRLLRVFDNILDLLDQNKIPCFYFDGQVSALQDYLEMRPEKEALIRAFIRAKKLFIGPFYCLIDEFLTDRVCFEKNLELGMKYAIDLGCTDFIGYLPDTFGHSQNIPEILREYGIDKAIVWRGCEDAIPSEFKWCGMDTVNLSRGYFNDIFSMKCSIEKKAELLKKELDLISEKSGLYILLPIGADHLGIEKDIQDQILSINEILKEDYSIKLGSPFEYFNKVGNNFEKFEYNNELRDNSKTFTLQGCYSSRLDLKRLNVEASHKLELASRFVRFLKLEYKYDSIIEYAYKMLLQNQAHDSICGCSTDDVHRENITRYKKILQIASTIIEELKNEANLDEKRILNLAENNFSGFVEIETSKKLEGFEIISTQKGFDAKLLIDTQRIPITEDYTSINTYLAKIENLIPDEVDFVIPKLDENDLKITNKSIENSKISLKIEDEKIYINNTPFNLIDFIDRGDSYNFGPDKDDSGYILKILKSKIHLQTRNRCTLRIDYESNWDIVSLFVSLDSCSNYLNFKFDWNNSQKNHLLQAVFELQENIKTVYSEDMNVLIKREFDSEYNIRENLPKTKGFEVKNNTAPMQRGLLVDETNNNLGIITKGLTQYEIYKNQIFIPILRAFGTISNPLNPARTTPAGPPIETMDSQMLGQNYAEFNVFFGNQNDFITTLNKIYNYIII